MSKRGLSNFGHSNRGRTLSAFLVFGSGKKAGLCWEQNWGAAEVLGSLGCCSLCEGSASCTVAVLSQFSWDRLCTQKKGYPLKSKCCAVWTKQAVVSWAGDDLALRPPSCVRSEEELLHSLRAIPNDDCRIFFHPVCSQVFCWSSHFPLAPMAFVLAASSLAPERHS